MVSSSGDNIISDGAINSLVIVSVIDGINGNRITYVILAIMKELNN